MDIEKDIDVVIEKIDADLFVLKGMLGSLDPYKTDWLQINQYLSWVKIKMINVYQVEHDERILRHIKTVDELIKEANEKYTYVNGM